MNKKMKILCIIMGPPLSQYDEQPSDQSECELIDCPKCNEKMWLSSKKKYLMKDFDEENILLACYICLKKFLLENPEFLSNITRVNL